MTEKIVIQRRDGLPMPLILLPSAEAMASWYAGQLRWSLEQGERELAVSCFDSAAMGVPLPQAVPAVLKAVTDFLWDHPEAERLTILCDGEDVYRAYSLYWNIWYAGEKTERANFL